MTIGDIVSVSGCFTKEKFIAGRSLAEIGKILGFHSGRLRAGMAVVALIELPQIHQFELAGYSNVATHRPSSTEGLNIGKIKAEVMASWATIGFERVVKLLPATGHNRTMNPDTQYPPGQGAPQWIATTSLFGRVVGIVTEYPNGRYVAADVARL